jgi:hypothetical protein
MSIEKLSEIADEIAASKKKLAEFAKSEGRSAIGAAFAACFAPPTNLKRISWRQYTPHFNDGDACVFSVHGVEMITEIDGVEEEHDDVEWALDSRDEKWGAELVAQIGDKSADAFLASWKKLGPEILEAVFGDHVTVTVTKDEVTVEECDHD